MFLSRAGSGFELHLQEFSLSLASSEVNGLSRVLLFSGLEHSCTWVRALCPWLGVKPVGQTVLGSDAVFRGNREGEPNVVRLRLLPPRPPGIGGG